MAGLPCISFSASLWLHALLATHLSNMRWHGHKWDILPGLCDTHPGSPNLLAAVREWQPCVPQWQLLSVWGPLQNGSEGHGKECLLCTVASQGCGYWSNCILSVESGSEKLWVGCCPHVFGTQQWNKRVVVCLNGNCFVQDVLPSMAGQFLSEHVAVKTGWR